MMDTFALMLSTIFPGSVLIAGVVWGVRQEGRINTLTVAGDAHEKLDETRFGALSDTLDRIEKRVDKTDEKITTYLLERK